MERHHSQQRQQQCWCFIKNDKPSFTNYRHGGSGKHHVLHRSALLLELGIGTAMAQAAVSFSKCHLVAVLHGWLIARMEPVCRWHKYGKSPGADGADLDGSRAYFRHAYTQP